MTTIEVSAEETLELVSANIQKHFPTTVFAIRLEEPVIDREDICGIDVVWMDGPSRDQVEDLLDPFQSVNWDPSTGELGGRVHLAIDPEGELIQVVYNIDYIFCDGPTVAMEQF